MTCRVGAVMIRQGSSPHHIIMAQTTQQPAGYFVMEKYRIFAE
jgi:hypothetical protein